MKTRIYTKNDQGCLEKLGNILRHGGLVAIPTETVYGLGANGLDPEAMDKIYTAKGRPSDNPLILHVPNQDAVAPLVKEITSTAKKLMDAFWPGPLTITLPKSDLVPYRATGGLERVALRCPGHELCRALLEEAGVPIAAPSANISGRPSPTSAQGVLHDMDGRIDAILDDGPCQIGVESTVVEVGDDEVIILRPGGITDSMLEQVVSKVSYDSHMTSGQGVPKAPGMKYKHYAPDADMVTYVGNREQVAAAIQDGLSHLEGNIGLLISEEVKETLGTYLDQDRIKTLVYGSMDNPVSLAHNLYASLLTFNELGVDHILAQGVPSKGIGVAIMNRMEKSSGHHVITL